MLSETAMPLDWRVVPSIFPEHGVLVRLERITNEVFSGRRRNSALNHLECGESVDALALAFQRKLMPTERTTLPVVIEKLKLGVLRNDAGEGDGAHWSILVQVAGHYHICDLTHIQFNLPHVIDHADPLTIQGHARGRYRQLFEDARPAVFRGKSREEAIFEWRSFIVRKPHVTAVRHAVSWHEDTQAVHGAIATS